MSEKPNNQREEVLDIIKNWGGITRRSAATFGIFELSSRIGELESEGWSFDREPMKGKNKYGRTWKCLRYSNPRK